MALPDAGNVEDYSEEEMKELLAKFETDKASLTKNQKAAVARYNFKKGKGEEIRYRGMAPAPAAAPAAAPTGTAPAAAGVSVSADIVSLLPPDMQALAARDPASLSKDEKIALARAKSQAVKAQQAAGAVAPAAAPDTPAGPSPEELARAKALEFPHAARLNEKFGETAGAAGTSSGSSTAAIELWAMQVHQPVATVKAPRVLDIIRYLHMEMGFDYLRNLTAADYPPDRFEVVYHLKNMVKRQDLALRVKLPREAPAGADMPNLPSVVGIHPGADWLEREVFDLFGIRFTGHPYMRRLMMPDGWVGHPLRKDYDSSKEQFVGLGADGHDIVSFDKEAGW